MKNRPFFGLKIILIIACICIGYGCNSHRDTAMSRRMQNLTSRYNYIYNSNTILNNHLLELTETSQEDYDQILPVFIGPEVDHMQVNPGLNLKSMDEIIRKAKIIILEKSFSNYTDDAYILLGKANFFNGNYFDAAEYFDYTAKTFKTNQASYIEALDWKARSLLQLKRVAQASQVLDTLDSILPKVKAKKLKAEPLATLAYMAILRNNDTAAISYLKMAVSMSRTNQHKIRWTYILAQLYERQRNFKYALANYRKVQKSSAPFEMYFNANLNQIRIHNLENNSGVNKQQQLRALLKDDKNSDYNDQVYFHLAESYAEEGAYDKALENYLISAQQSKRNSQKGISYLRLANLYLNHFRDYLSAKTYFDSTVNILPVSYPGYDLIAKKNANLQYLTDRYDLIALQDSLQVIAQLPQEFHEARIQTLINPVAIPNPIGTTQTVTEIRQQVSGVNRPSAQSTFYFSNPSAISIGFSDFKRIWGNRKLENNWRQSVRTVNPGTGPDIVNTETILPDPGISNAGSSDTDSLSKKYMAALPLTPSLLAESDHKRINAYYEIANFYMHELADTREANAVYQTLLNRYPENNHLVSIYYSLYLINKETDPVKSEDFKNKVLKGFPGSEYAKAILDPEFSLKQSDLQAQLHSQYNEIFNLYERKNFSEVIQKVNEALKSGGTNPLSAQLSYLKAISVGRTNHVDNLLNEFSSIVQNTSQDSLITPLVRSHINYISAHMEMYKKRKIALIDADFAETPFPEPAKPSSSPAKPKVTQSPIALVPDTVQKAKITPPKTMDPPVAQNPVKETPTVHTDGTFSTAASSIYFYVVHVADASLTLSSSRFGIGQFNRGNYSGSQLRHQLKEFDNDQLIYVGNFTNFEDVKSYATAITPQLKQIMKVPVNIYDSFIISKENFDKLVSNDLLNRYIEFYKKHY